MNDELRQSKKTHGTGKQKKQKHSFDIATKKKTSMLMNAESIRKIKNHTAQENPKNTEHNFDIATTIKTAY